MAHVVATVGDIVVAESDNTILIEGNYYFPPADVNQELLEDSELHTQCPWKGVASYKTMSVGGKKLPDIAWYYPEPAASSIDRVKTDYTGWFAFYKCCGLEIKET